MTDSPTAVLAVEHGEEPGERHDVAWLAGATQPRQLVLHHLSWGVGTSLLANSDTWHSKLVRDIPRYM